jgi:hypothetical protein
MQAFVRAADAEPPGDSIMIQGLFDPSHGSPGRHPELVETEGLSRFCKKSIGPSPAFHWPAEVSNDFNRG